MSNQLLPCPFCGGKAERLTLQDEENFGGDIISCQNCDACSQVVFGEKEGLVEAWNRRATQPAAGEPVASGVNYAEEVDLIRAVLEGYSPSIARSDALCSVKLLKAYFAAPPATAPVAAGEPVYQYRNWRNQQWIDTDQAGLRAAAESGWDTRTLWTAPPAAAHEDEAVRKDAAAAYVAMSCNSVLIDGSTCYYLPAERMAAFDRMFSLGDAMRAQAGEGGEV